MARDPQSASFSPQLGKDELACLMLFLSQSIWVLSFIYPNEHNFTPFETMLLRGGTAVTLSLLVCLIRGYPIDFNPAHCSMWSLNLRNFIMTLQGATCALVQFYLPLPIVHIIGCSGSIFICIVDYLRYGVVLSRQQILGVGIGLFGISLVVNNRWLEWMLGRDPHIDTGFENYRTNSAWVMTLVALFFVLVTIIWAYGVVETKKLSSLNTFQINLHFGAWTLFSSALLYPLCGAHATLQQMLAGVATTGVPMVVGQFLFIGAFGMSRNHGKISLMTFSTVLMSYTVSILRYHESVNIMGALGTAFALFGVFKCLLHKN